MLRLNRIGSHRLALLCVAASLLFAPRVQATAFGTELIVNGNAELGNTSGWTSTGIDAVASSTAGFAGLPQGVSTESFSFTGGAGNAASQSLTQSADISDIFSFVDSAAASFSFSVLIQSRRQGGVTDTASGSLRFLNSANAMITSLAFSDPSIVEGVYDWALIERAGNIPIGTRHIQIFLDVSRPSGISSDGFFDNASLSVSAVPEPWSASLVLVGIVSVLAITRRSRMAQRLTNKVS